jgi:hypothetical protein
MSDTDDAWIERLIANDAFYAKSRHVKLTTEEAKEQKRLDDDVLKCLYRKLDTLAVGSIDYETVIFQIYSIGGFLPVTASDRPMLNREEWRDVGRIHRDSLKGKGWNRPHKERGKKFQHEVEDCIFQIKHYQQFFWKSGIGRFSPATLPDGFMAPALLLPIPIKALTGESGDTGMYCLNGGSKALSIFWEAVVRNDHQFFEAMAWELKNSCVSQSDAGKLAGIALTARTNLGRNPTRRELEILGPRIGLRPASWPKLFEAAGLSATPTFLPPEQGRRNDLYSRYLRNVKHKK